MKILVSMGLADNPSPDVLVDPLCSVELVGIEKGKAFLFDEGFDKLQYTLELKGRVLEVNCGDTIEFYDPDYMNIIRGRIISWKNRCSVDKEGMLDYSQIIDVEHSIV